MSLVLELTEGCHLMDISVSSTRMSALRLFLLIRASIWDIYLYSTLTFNIIIPSYRWIQVYYITFLKLLVSMQWWWAYQEPIYHQEITTRSLFITLKPCFPDISCADESIWAQTFICYLIVISRNSLNKITVITLLRTILY